MRESVYNSSRIGIESDMPSRVTQMADVQTASSPNSSHRERT